MPVSIRKTSGGRYRVSTPHGTKAKHTTYKKAKAQERLLNAVDHGWKPDGRKAKKRSRQESLELAEHIVDQLLSRDGCVPG